MSDADLLAAVGRTALGVARVRARESARPDALFDDPYAFWFASADPAPETAPEESPERRAFRAAIAFHVVIRTRFYDDYLLDAVIAGCRQVVLLGAGLDTRAFRLRWPDGVRVFELDQPDVLRHKEKVLRERRAQPRCERVTVPADLREDWAGALTRAGLRASGPTAWLAEGLLVYLDAETVHRLLDLVTATSAPGSSFAAERGDATSAGMAGADVRVSDDVRTLWHASPGETVDALLGHRGWSATVYELGDVAARYGRTPPTETRSAFVTAGR